MKFFENYERAQDAVQLRRAYPLAREKIFVALKFLVASGVTFGLTWVAQQWLKTVVSSAPAVLFLSLLLGFVLVMSLLLAGMFAVLLAVELAQALFGVTERTFTLDASGFRQTERWPGGLTQVAVRVALEEMAGFQVRKVYNDTDTLFGEKHCGVLIKMPAGADDVWVWRSSCGMEHLSDVTRWVRDLNEVLGTLRGMETPVFVPETYDPADAQYSQVTSLVQGSQTRERLAPPEGMAWNVSFAEDGILTLGREGRFSFWRMVGALAGGVLAVGLVSMCIGLTVITYGQKIAWPDHWGLMGFFGMMLFFWVIGTFVLLAENLGGDNRWEIGPEGIRKIEVRLGRAKEKKIVWQDCADVEIFGPLDEKTDENPDDHAKIIPENMRKHGYFYVNIRDTQERSLTYVGNLTLGEAEWLRDEILRMR